MLTAKKSKPVNPALSLFANYIGQGWSAVMAIAFLPFFIHVLGNESYGLIGFFSTLQSVLAVFDLGITPTLTRESARYRANLISDSTFTRLVYSLENLIVVLSIALFMLVLVCAHSIAIHWVNPVSLSDNTVNYSIMLMGFVLSTRLLEGVYRGILIGLDLQIRLNILTVIVSTLRYFGAAFLLLFLQSIDAFFLWQSLVSVIALFIYFGQAHDHLPKAATRPPLYDFCYKSKGLTKFSRGMAKIGILSVLLANGDKLVLSKTLRLDQFAYYVLASTAACTLYVLVVPITQAFYSRLVSEFELGDSVKVRGTVLMIGRLVSILVGSASLMLYFFSNEIIFIWSGNQALINEVSPILKILSIAALANCFSHVATTIQLAQGDVTTVVRINIFIVTLMLVCVYFFCMLCGVEAAAQVYLILALLQMVLLFYVVFSQDPFICHIPELIKALAFPLLTAAFTLFIFFLMFSFSDSRMSDGVILLFDGAATVLLGVFLIADLRQQFINFIWQKIIQG